MFRKLLLASAILAVSSSIAYATGPYVGISAGIQTNTSSSANARVVPITLSAGYGASICQNFYLGGEVFGVPYSWTVSDNGLKSTYGYGASIIPGIMLGDHTIGYVRAGVVRSHFTNSNSNVNGSQLGLGMQTSLCQNWDVRGEYVYTAYRNTSSGGSPKADQFNLGLVYRFE